MQFIHLCARARYPKRPLVERDPCADLWQRLGARFNRVLACVLMPNHLHLVIESSAPEEDRRRLVTELVAFAQSRFPGQRVWEATPEPEIIADRHHLKRHIRYVHLNPCRAGLASDPLQWEWSTHRDAVGAVAQPWVDQKTLRSLWTVPARDFGREFHAYVSGDPSVRVDGSPLPGAIDPTRLVASLDRIEDAVRQVGRLRDGAFRARDSQARRLGALVAIQMGGRDRNDLAKWLGVSRRGLWNVLNVRTAGGPESEETEAQALEAVYWVLGHLERFCGRREVQLPKMGS